MPILWQVAESALGQLRFPTNSMDPLLSCGCPVPAHWIPTRQVVPLSVEVNWECRHGGWASFAAAQPALVKSVTANGAAGTTPVTVKVTPEGICASQVTLTHSAEPLAFWASALVPPIGNPAREIATPPPPPLPTDCGDSGPEPSTAGLDDSGPEPSTAGVAVKPALAELECAPADAAGPPQPASSRTNRPASGPKRKTRGEFTVTPRSAGLDDQNARRRNWPASLPPFRTPQKREFRRRRDAWFPVIAQLSAAASQYAPVSIRRSASYQLGGPDAPGDTCRRELLLLGGMSRQKLKAGQVTGPDTVRIPGHTGRVPLPAARSCRVRALGHGPWVS